MVRSLAAVKCRPLSLLLRSLIPRRLSPSGKLTPPPLSHCLTTVDDSLWISATPATTILSRTQSQHLDPQMHRVFDPKSRIEPGVEPHRSDVWQFISFAVLATLLIDIMSYCVAVVEPCWQSGFEVSKNPRCLDWA